MGRGGPACSLKFIARTSGPGQYTFESTWLPGFFLTVDDNIDGSRPFLSALFGASFQDIRTRFELYASQEDFQMSLFSFATIEPLGVISDSRVL